MKNQRNKVREPAARTVDFEMESIRRSIRTAGRKGVESISDRARKDVAKSLKGVREEMKAILRRRIAS